MTVKNAKNGGTDWVDGDVLYAADLNDTFDSAIVLTDQVYTSTGFDSVSNFDASTDEQSYEFTSISAAKLVQSTYLEIDISAVSRVFALNGTATVEIKVQTKEVGGSYADSLTYTIFSKAPYTNSTVTDTTQSKNFKYFHTLTAGEKSNGVQVKVFSRSACGNANSYADFTNVNTSVKVN